MEEDNSWGKYPLSSNGVSRIFLGVIINFITQSRPSPSRQSGEPIRR